MLFQITPSKSTDFRNNYWLMPDKTLLNKRDRFEATSNHYIVSESELVAKTTEMKSELVTTRVHCQPYCEMTGNRNKRSNDWMQVET